jgi:hypothetical protein
MMLVRMCLPLLAALAALALAVDTASAGERRLVLVDHINHAWHQELVSYAPRFAPGECHRSSLTLTGPQGEVPLQLSEVKQDARGLVTAARLSFITDLPALGQVVHTLRYGTARHEAVRPPATDLSLTGGDGWVALTTAKAGVRLLSGSRTYTPPRLAAEVPGPVLGLRTLEGTWIGGSSLYGGRKLASYEARVEESGPVFALARITYHYADGGRLAVTARVVAGQGAVFFAATSPVHRPEDGWRLDLSRGYPSPTLSVRGEYEGNKWGLHQGDIGHGDLAAEPAGTVYRLVPWEDWWDGTTGTVFALSSPASDTVLSVATHGPGAWMDPAWVAPSQRHRYPFVPQSHWERRLFKAMPLTKAADGEIILECGAHLGERKWLVGFVPKQADPDWSFLEAAALHDSRYGCQTLDEVKDYVLDWPARSGTVYPHLYVAKEDAAAARQTLGQDVPAIEAPFYRPYRKDSGERWRVQGRDLMQHMVDSAYWTPVYTQTLESNPNKFDLMRHSPLLVNLFDALMATGQLSAAEQKLRRAQIAFLGYRLSSPYVWDIERGYAGDENNMHLAYQCNLGLVACALPDHPMAKAWAAQATKWVRTRLAGCVGQNGVWTVENPHYANVSLSCLLPFAIASQRAGFYPFLEDPKLRAWAMYLAKQLTPRDPRYGGVRSEPPEQFQERAERTCLAGLMAKAVAHLDPDYARVMQWAWQEQGFYPEGVEGKMAGFERLTCDPAAPARQPDRGSEAFPKATVIMRQGLGTPDEYYLRLAICDRPAPGYYLSQPGSVTLYAHDKPLALVFAGCFDVCTSESFLTNAVSLARTPPASAAERIKNKGCLGASRLLGFSALPRQDYARAEYHLDEPLPIRDYYQSRLPVLPAWPPLLKEARAAGITWRRQILFVKGSHASDPGYFLFRDTTTGGQPTAWHMWTLSRGLGTPAEVADPDAFLAGASGSTARPARELKGDRFTALGQFDVDADYFIAAPTDTPRHALRWGYRVGGNDPGPWEEYQDLLHLQSVGDGVYYVALFPRHHGEPAPEFERLGGGLIIKTRGAFGTDYGFLSDTEAEASGEEARFRGTAASVQDRGDGLVLALGAKGSVACRGYRLASAGAASLCVTGSRATLAAYGDGEGETISLGLPPGKSLAPAAPQHVQVTHTDTGLYTIRMARSVRQVELTVR